jgi:hypothetical protein
MLVLKYRCNSMSPCGGKYLDERTCSGVVSSCDVLNYSNLKLPCFNIPPAPCGWFLKCLAWPDLGYDGMVLGYLCLFGSFGFDSIAQSGCIYAENSLAIVIFHRRPRI